MENVAKMDKHGYVGRREREGGGGRREGSEAKVATLQKMPKHVSRHDLHAWIEIDGSRVRMHMEKKRGERWIFL